MKLDSVKFDRYVGPEQGRTFTSKNYDLQYMSNLRAISVRNLKTQAFFVVDQAGAEWVPVLDVTVLYHKEPDGRPAAPAAGKLAPATPSRKR